MKLAANGVREAQGLIRREQRMGQCGGLEAGPPSPAHLPAWLWSASAEASSSLPGEGGKGHLCPGMAGGQSLCENPSNPTSPPHIQAIDSTT